MKTATQTLAGLGILFAFSIALLAGLFVTRYGLQQHDSVSISIGAASGLMATGLGWFVVRTSRAG